MQKDIIYRQAAVELAMKYCPDDDGAVQCDGDIRGLLDELENLPAAQPEIIHCKDCKHHFVHRCMDSIPTEICDLNQTFYDAEVDFCSLAER